MLTYDIIRNLILVLVLLLKCKAVTYSEATGKSYAEGDFLFFYYHLFLTYHDLWTYAADLYYSSLSQSDNKVKKLRILRYEK